MRRTIQPPPAPAHSSPTATAPSSTADLVVHALDQTNAAHRDVLTTLLTRCAHADVVVDADALPERDALAPGRGANVRTVPTFTRTTILGCVTDATVATKKLGGIPADR
ncbi:MAG: hypothetical protein U0W40_18475 [Acidimicrobiia bacterium]